MNPSKVYAVSELLLSSVPETPIPANGKIVVTWPEQFRPTADFMRIAKCLFKVPPTTLPVTCKFTKNTDKNVVLTISNFGVEVNDFFTISINNVKAPRSTSLTDSFILKTYDSADT